MSRPVVAVDAAPAVRAQRTGTELVAWELCRRLPAAAPDLEFRFFAPVTGDGDVPVVRLPARRLFSQLRLPRELWRHRPDLVFAPAHVVPFLSPARTVTIVHDLAFERFPEAYSARDLRYLRLTTRWAERRCRLLITPSEATRQDLLQLHRVDPVRVVTVHPGGGERVPELGADEVDRRLWALGVERPYILQVGRVEPKKRPQLALRAVERLAGLRLVLAGATPDPELAALLESSPACTLLGRVTDADREALYQAAAAVVMPSIYEGFGFPLLEAMRRGAPVVATAVSSLPEIGGDAAYYLEDAADAASFAATLARAMEDRPQLAIRGRARAARFTWERCTGGVAEVLRAALA
ncbi:MAG: glycosyltransferase family 4 protein [Candidatus Dormibacteraeota bacterium]|nr:glycosyltransferase family 4 protein [Candidatus Dormibacteraeota bacterium]